MVNLTKADLLSCGPAVWEAQSNLPGKCDFIPDTAVSLCIFSLAMKTPPVV